MDGPDEIEVPLSATHPDDNRTGFGHAKVRVNNLPPASKIDDVLNVEPSDGVLNPDSPEYDYLAIKDLEVMLTASFTDPGSQDTQTAELDWDDGTVVPSPDFESFSDAYGGATGQIEAAHAYREVNNIYTVTLSVVDDDGDDSPISGQIMVINGNTALDLVKIGLNNLLTRKLIYVFR